MFFFLDKPIAAMSNLIRSALRRGACVKGKVGGVFGRRTDGVACHSQSGTISDSADRYAVHPIDNLYLSSSSPLARLIPQISRHLLMPRDEELPLPLMPPHQHPNLLRIPTRRLKLRLRVEILEQEPNRCLHPIPFQLPQPYLVDYRGGKHGLILRHLRMGVGGEVAYDLVARDAHADGAADGLAGYFSGDHVWIACDEAGEELQDGDLEIGGGVGVYAVVGLDDDEAAVFFCGGGEGGAQAACVGGEGGG